MPRPRRCTAGPGDPPEGPGRGPPRHRHQLQQPGRDPRGPGEVRRGRGDAPPRPGDPPEGPGRGPPRHRRQLQQPGRGPPGPGEVRRGRGDAPPRPGDLPEGPGRGAPRHRHQLQQPGRALEAQGKYAEAEAMHRRALAIRLKALGEGHPDTATSYNNLAATLRAQGKQPAEAEAMHRRALAIRLEGPGRGHTPDTAISYNNLAVTLGPGEACRGRGVAPPRPGDPPEGPGRGPPRHRHQLQQPGRSSRTQGKHDEALRTWRSAAASYEQARLLRPQGARSGARGRLSAPRPRRRPGPRRPAARGLGELGAGPGPRDRR